MYNLLSTPYKANNKIILLIFLLLLTSPLISQEKKSGFIITNSLDTIYGQISKGKLKTENYRRCKFQSNDNTISKTFLPGDIHSFYISDDNNLFASERVTIENKDSLVFLEVLVDGIVNIYYYKTFNEPYYFIEKEKDKIIPLTRETYYLTHRSGYGKVEVDSNYYIDTLHKTMEDCPELFYSIEKTALNQKSLINIANTYHNQVCTTGEECIIYEKEKNFHLRFGINAGYNHSYFKIINQNYGYSSTNTLKTSDPFFGVVLYISPSYNSAYSNFCIYSNISFPEYIEETNDDLKNQITFLSWDNTFLYEYIFPVSKSIKPVVSAGLNLGYRKATGHYIAWDLDGDNLPFSNPVMGLNAETGFNIHLPKTPTIFVRAAYAFHILWLSNTNDISVKAGFVF